MQTHVYILRVRAPIHLPQLGAHGLGLPERAWLEHNLTSLGGLYDNLYVTEAARLLGMDSAQKAEKVRYG
jgi:hypothetical protein